MDNQTASALAKFVIGAALVIWYLSGIIPALMN